MNTQRNNLKVGISGCLVGENIRYDGTNKLQSHLIFELRRYFELIPLCPEVGAGLGIPRPPVQLVQLGNEIHALGLHDKSLDVTTTLLEYVESACSIVNGLSGFVFKARSPSCGVESTPLFEENGTQVGLRSGLFAEVVKKRFPDLPIAEEDELADAKTLEQFIAEVNRQGPAL